MDKDYSGLLDPFATRRSIRRLCLVRRSQMGKESVDALINNMRQAVTLPPQSVIACVWPLPGEPVIVPLLNRLHFDGYRVALPEVAVPDGPLIFRYWTPGCLMKKGRHGTLYPITDTVKPDMIFVPILAFDKAGYRLGYGGGYYDRTLASLEKIKATGFAFSCQEVEQIPAYSHDVPLSEIVTEKGIFIPNKPCPLRRDI